MTIRQATAVFGVGRRTVYNWIERGQVVVVRTPGGTIRMTKASLLAGARR